MTTGSGGQLLGTGSALPRRVVRNDDLPPSLNTSDEWIVQRTGIRARRVCAPEETTATLGLAAARNALESANLPASAIDLIVFATVTPDMMVPATACNIQAELGCRAIPAFDLNAACSGFVYALAVADQFVQTGACEHALVIGADTLSRIVDFTDRTTCILFGDGAGAVVLGRGDGPARHGSFFRLHADGRRRELIKLNGVIHRPPMAATPVTPPTDHGDFLRFKGPEVFKFAVTTLSRSIHESLEESGLTAADIDLVIPHQVNQRILDAAFPSLGIPAEKLVVNLEHYGNTSSASVAIALDEAARAGRARRGDTLLLVGFGAGMTWGTAIVPFMGRSAAGSMTRSRAA